MWRRFEASLTRGRPQKEQVVLVWTTAALDGKDEAELDLDELAESCSMRVESVVEILDRLAADRVLYYEPTPTGIRVSLAPLQATLICDEPPRQKFSLAPYLAIWKEYMGGYFDARFWARKFAKEERRIGAEKLQRALKSYLETTSPTYASPRAFFDRLDALLSESAPVRVEYDPDIAKGTKQW